MPYYTFQFGAFKFPSGINHTDTLYFQPVATRDNDLCLVSISGGCKLLIINGLWLVFDPQVLCATLDERRAAA